MKNITLLLLVALFAIGFSTEAKSETVYSLTVEWGYTPPMSPAVVAYKLYRNGSQVIQWQGATTVKGQLVISLPETTDTSFTLTAIFADSTESPHSSPYLFNPSRASMPATVKDFKRIASMLGTSLKKGTNVRCGKLFATT